MFVLLFWMHKWPELLFRSWLARFDMVGNGWKRSFLDNCLAPGLVEICKIRLRHRRCLYWKSSTLVVLFSAWAHNLENCGQLGVWATMAYLCTWVRNCSVTSVRHRKLGASSVKVSLRSYLAVNVEYLALLRLGLSRAPSWYLFTSGLQGMYCSQRATQKKSNVPSKTTLNTSWITFNIHSLH